MRDFTNKDSKDRGKAGIWSDIHSDTMGYIMVIHNYQYPLGKFSQLHTVTSCAMSVDCSSIMATKGGVCLNMLD